MSAVAVSADLDALADALDGAPTGPSESLTLADWLYQGWYLNVRPAEPRLGAPLPAEVDLVASLAAAHAGSCLLYTSPSPRD